MALIKDITDSKGIKTSYHKIQSFTYEDGKLVVRVASYASKGMREAEQAVEEQIQDYNDYEKETDVTRTELDKLVSKQIEGKKVDVEEVKRLTGIVNERSFAEERPQLVEPIQTSYDIAEVELEYFEPLTLEAIYTKLSEIERYSGSNKS